MMTKERSQQVYAHTNAITKITRPRLEPYLPRNRLFEILERARCRPVVWICGPPGSGKTSLVTSYLTERQLACIWFQLDVRDIDAVSFFYYLRLASGKAAPRKHNNLPLLTPEYSHGLSVFTHDFFEKIYARHKTPFVFVFDNYQEIPNNAMLHSMMRDALMLIPEDINVILISRNDPPPALARVQAERAMARLSWNELRFTESESLGIAEILSQGKKLPRTAIKAFHEQANGWVAGLVLQIEQLPRNSSLSAPPNTVIPGAVFDYFATETLERAEDETRDLLLKTAFLVEITEDAARVLTGNPEAPHLLSDLVRRNYFTERFSKSERSYRYHPFFRNFLQVQARAVFAPEQLAEIQGDTAKLLVAAGRIEEAAELLQTAADWPGLIELILQHAPRLVAEARFQVLETWLGYVSLQVRTTQPWLLYWLGVCRMFTAAVEARGFFEQAFALFERAPEPTGRLLCCSGALDAILLNGSDFSLMDRWISWVDEHVSADAVLPANDIEVRVATSLVGALLYREPHHPDIEQWAERALKAAEITTDINLRLRAYTNVALFFKFCGCLHSNAIMERFQPLVRRHPTSPSVQLNWKWIETSFKWTSGDGELAMASVDEGLELAATSGVHNWDHLLLIEGIYSALSAGDIKRAGKYLEHEGAILDHDKTHMLGLHEYLLAWYRLLCGETQRAVDHAQSAVKLATQTGSPYPEAVYRLALLQAQVADGALSDAENELVVTGELVARLNRPFFTFMYKLASADVAFHQCREEKGLSALKAAMTLGSRQDYMSLFTWNSKLMACLCAKALEHHIEIDYVERLVRQRKLTGDKSPIELENWPWPIRIYTLGHFSVVKNGQPMQFPGKSPTKQLELLKALIAFGSQRVKETQLSDTLWPDAEGDMAYQNFTATLHRLRKLIGHEGVELNDRRVTLNPKYCWVDCNALEHMLDRIKISGQGGDESSLVHKAVRLYKGPFLAEEADFWVRAPRERLDKKFKRVLDCYGFSVDRKNRVEEVFIADE